MTEYQKMISSQPYNCMAPELDLLRRETARLYRKLERSFPGHSVLITSGTRDGRLKVVHIWNDTSPGDFYLFNTETNAADLIFSRRSWLDPATLAPSESVAVSLTV